MKINSTKTIYILHTSSLPNNGWKIKWNKKKEGKSQRQTHDLMSTDEILSKLYKKKKDYCFHSQQIKIHQDTFERFNSDVLGSALRHPHQNTNKEIQDIRSLFYPSGEFRHLEKLWKKEQWSCSGVWWTELTRTFIFPVIHHPSVHHSWHAPHHKCIHTSGLHQL